MSTRTSPTTESSRGSEIRKTTRLRNPGKVKLMRIAFFGSVTVMAFFAACSSSSTDAPGSTTPDASDTDSGVVAQVDGSASDDATADAADATVPALTCTARTWCTDYTVKAFRATPPTAQGGTIVEGTYRLAYTIEPAGIDNAYVTDTAALLYFSNGRFEAPGSTGFGAVGTYSTGTGADGPTLLLKGLTNCNFFGAQGSPANQTRTYPFSATATEITLISTITPGGPDAGAPWKRASVYLKNDGDLCAPATKDPATPADSFFCRVANCACAQSTGSPISPASCPFIH